MYAVAIHMIELARRASPQEALKLLILSGKVYADSERPDAVACPEFPREDFIASASDGAKLLSPLLPLAKDFDTFKWAVAGLAGFIGHHRLSRFLDGLDYYEGKFHHLWIGGPFPPDVQE